MSLQDLGLTEILGRRTLVGSRSGMVLRGVNTVFSVHPTIYPLLRIALRRGEALIGEPAYEV